MNIRHYIKDENGFLNGSFAMPQSFPTFLLDEDIVKTFKKPRIVNDELIEGKTIDEERTEKMTKLRGMRDGLLMSTIWIMQRHQGELEGLAKNLTTNPTTLSEEKYSEWLVYWRDLRDLPENVVLDDFTFENIETAFPAQPV